MRAMCRKEGTPMWATIIGGLVGAAIYIYVHRHDYDLRIGQKVYYYLQDKNKKYSGRITAKVTCCRKEDITEVSNSRRIIPLSDRKIKTSEYIVYEIQPIIGGEKIFLSDKNILRE